MLKIRCLLSIAALYMSPELQLPAECQYKDRAICGEWSEIISDALSKLPWWKR